MNSFFPSRNNQLQIAILNSNTNLSFLEHGERDSKHRKHSPKEFFVESLDFWSHLEDVKLKKQFLKDFKSEFQFWLIT